MNRRAFLSALGLAAVGVPLLAAAARETEARPSPRAVRRRERFTPMPRRVAYGSSTGSAHYRGAMLFYDVGGCLTPVAADGLEFAGYQIESTSPGDVAFTLDMRARP